jgi:hypothetical protein
MLDETCTRGGDAIWCVVDDSFAEFLQPRTQCKRSSCGERSEVQIRLVAASSYSLLTFSFHVIHEILRIARYLCSARRITHVGLSAGRATHCEAKQIARAAGHISTLCSLCVCVCNATERHLSLSCSFIPPWLLCAQITISRSAYQANNRFFHTSCATHL